MYHKLMLENQTLFTKKVFKQLVKQDLSSGQPRILEYLNQNQNVMQKDIAVACMIEPPSVTSVLTKMEKEGLVEKNINLQNRRSVYVALTPKGKEKADIVDCVFKEIEDSALENLTQEERETLMYLLKKINTNLKK